MWFGKRLLLVFGTSLILLCPSLGFGQTGRILGTVADETGVVIPGVTVTAASQATNIRREFVTDDTGNYDFPRLLVGTSTVRAQISGFKTAEVDHVVRQNLRLVVGQLNEVIQVLAYSPLLPKENVGGGQVINNRKIIELPLNGRLYTDFALLVPGVTTRGPGFRPGAPGVVSINGSRGGRANYMIDGVTTNASNERMAQFIPSIESIQASDQHFQRRIRAGIGTEPFLMADSRNGIVSRQYVAHWIHSFSPKLLSDFQYSQIEFDSLRLAGPVG